MFACVHVCLCVCVCVCVCVGGGGGGMCVCVCVCLRKTENWNSSFKTLFYKDCSLGLVKKPSNN